MSCWLNTLHNRDTETISAFRFRLDCEQSLFFVRSSKGSARARERWAAKPRVTRVVICMSRAFCSTDQEKRETACSLIFVFIDSLVVSASQDAGGYAISRQNNLELHLGCHTCWLSYSTLVCLWHGRTVGRAYGHVITRISRMGRLPNFLTHGVPLRALVAGGASLLRINTHDGPSQLRSSKYWRLIINK